jgi:hypothetical protein
MNYGNSAKKKKKKKILVISGILVIAGIGTIAYFAWPKKETKTEIKIHNKEKIKQLQTELSSLKSKLNNLSDNTQKTQLENKLSNIENKIKNLSENPNKSTLKNLELEIKKAIEDKDNPNEDDPDRNDDPDEDPEPTNKDKAKVKFIGKSLKDQDSGDFDNYKFLKEGTQGIENIFYISKNHPRIKELLSQNKLQKDKKFTVRYGKVDEKSDSGLLFTFNENNKELEIIEIGNPNPQPDKGFKWVSAKINDNTYKYKITLDGGEIDFSDFIELLKNKKGEFFQAFQGALKDANSKFPAYF